MKKSELKALILECKQELAEERLSYNDFGKTPIKLEHIKIKKGILKDLDNQTNEIWKNSNKIASKDDMDKLKKIIVDMKELVETLETN